MDKNSALNLLLIKLARTFNIIWQIGKLTSLILELNLILHNIIKTRGSQGWILIWSWRVSPPSWQQITYSRFFKRFNQKQSNSKCCLRGILGCLKNPGKLQLPSSVILLTEPNLSFVSLSRTPDKSSYITPSSFTEALWFFVCNLLATDINHHSFVGYYFCHFINKPFKHFLCYFLVNLG